MLARLGWCDGEPLAHGLASSGVYMTPGKGCTCIANFVHVAHSCRRITDDRTRRIKNVPFVLE